jgi:ABC-type multidrug transport system ATPase subunit
MFGVAPERILSHASERNGGHHSRVPLHYPQDDPMLPPSQHENAQRNEAGLSTDDLASTPSHSSTPDGTWGERDATEHVNARDAMIEYEEMRRTLTGLERTQTQQTRKSYLGRTRSLARRQTTHATEASEAQEGANGEEQDGDEFSLHEFLEEGHLGKRDGEGRATKKVGVVFKHLSVEGVGATVTFVKTLPDAILGTFGPDLYRLASRFIPVLPRIGAGGEKRVLINDFTGVVRDGEMMLVLGRPGSGCSTFLKAVTNKVDGFAGVSGEVSYGGISAEEQAKKYRGEVNYNEEDDQHFPSLTVAQTLKFSLLNKTKKHEKGSIPIILDALLKMFGISHTRHTLVGDAFTRGVSGGERKRVSIAETMATKSAVVAWDNSTRGLDASTALDYARSLRVLTDISQRTTLVALYQAGEGIFKLMDKVLVIDEGRMVYQGPASEARQYFTDLGYYAPDRQTTADFLTACTDPGERRFRKDIDVASVPKGAVELEKAFRASAAYQAVLRDVEGYESALKESGHADAKDFKASVKEQQSRTVSKSSPYTVSFFRQVVSCTKREFWLTMGDTTTLYTKAFIIISMSLIVGSLFYGQRLDTSGAFSRGGSLFFSILFLGWLQLGELMKAVSGRSITARHKHYAFYRPSAVVIARVLQDFPVLLVEVVPFGLVMYFMTGLDVDAGKFFIYLLFIYVNTICITSLYRMFAALSPTIDDAVRFSGTALNLLIIFTGYVIAKPVLVSKYIWFGWLYYLNPIAYSFEAVLANEFAGRTMACAPENTVPSGPGFNAANQGCTLTGARVGSLNVSGDDYLETTFDYKRANLWRNFGVVIAWSVLYILVTAVASEVFSFTAEGGGALEFKKTKQAKQVVKVAAPADEETGGVPEERKPQTAASSDTAVGAAEEERADEALQALQDESRSVFTWKDVEYTVPYQGGQKKLLNKVSGYAKPGLMIALMGASGAGKTTLLNTLAQRQKTGVVTGDMLVDGRPLGKEFQRGTGFCEQMDLHDGTATIREALEFSAILRQEHTVPRAEKIAYVDKIIDLLELGEVQHALIRSLGVEQRKRVTIGVELAAKPNLLLFLDEPTSGLDSQSAYSIVRFLRKLAATGQAIVCTIHQPSSVLIQEFDMILALNPGGNTFYFGPVGDNGSAVVKYFADRGVECPPEKNVAEFILETAAKSQRGKDGKRIKWTEEWLNSPQRQEVEAEIARIAAERSQAPVKEAQDREFASPVWLQTTELTKRMFAHYWRDPSYLYGKLFVSVIIGIFNGFTFWQLGNSVADMQNRMFTSFLIIVIPPTIVNAVVPKFYQNRALWEAREHPSRIYGWFAFCTANIVAEIPISIVGGLVYWLIWYWPTGLPGDSSTSGYVFLMSMLFFLFQASWGQWICAFAPSFTVISNVLPFFFVLFSLFNGVVRPYDAIPVFWRYWVYYLLPSTYWIGGVLAATLPGTPVVCAPDEAAYFNPPSGSTCEEYAGGWASASGGALLNPEATEQCGYCPFTDGSQYLRQLHVEPGNKWPCMAIFLLFCITNWLLVYFFIYTTRVREWSFGLDTVFGWAGKGVSKVKGMLKGKKREE